MFFREENDMESSIGKIKNSEQFFEQIQKRRLPRDESSDNFLNTVMRHSLMTDNNCLETNNLRLSDQCIANLRQNSIQLSIQQQEELITHQRQTLQETERIEFGTSSLGSLLEKFADSPFLEQSFVQNIPMRAFQKQAKNHEQKESLIQDSSYEDQMDTSAISLGISSSIPIQTRKSMYATSDQEKHNNVACPVSLDIFKTLLEYFYNVRDNIPTHISDEEIFDALRTTFDQLEGDIASIELSEIEAKFNQEECFDLDNYDIINSENCDLLCESPEWNYDEFACGWDGEHWDEEFENA